ncbi:MAG: hypothetical protein RQ767_05245 [Thermovirgaceae bacterium]|nr:hypothetical protein [Thermovirgaceae bacterium]
MRKNFLHLEKYRVQNQLYPRTEPGERNGCFVLPHNGIQLCCICSDELGWDHVSVSVRSKDGKKLVKRTPSWEEMEHIKRQFWEASEIVVQYHVAEADHINVHPFVLHLWRDQNSVYPLPPKEMV